MMWTKSEEKFLRSLNTPYKVQSYLDTLIYNTGDTVASVRYVLLSEVGHCFEGCLVAFAALELQGLRPRLINLMAEDDDYHAIVVYKTKSGWGSLSKSNTTLLASRMPVYRTLRELLMSYFDFYFNVKGKLALYSHSSPINLNRYKSWDWKTSDENIIGLSLHLSTLPHFELINLKDLKSLPRVSDRLKQACFLGADPDGLYKI